MPPVSASPVIQLLIQFAELAATEQAAFLDTLNVYLYTSPQQRRMLRHAWSKGLEGLTDVADAPPRTGGAPRRR
ncbi:hypothetical protein [Stenotrophomonas tumulicola]|uniref:Uncharacterized protein n=1 Tax=Stenotrophomonas tumulicola TaxID=1685415 RepID=A0A7W3FJQ0_9GAMM|nr:hypothetical protein [Stenotrophomonas tumulicola]MBA8680823.1 hypothetical protein [Stenotrophomonas tumulicola]